MIISLIECLEKTIKGSSTLPAHLDILCPFGPALYIALGYLGFLLFKDLLQSKDVAAAAASHV